MTPFLRPLFFALDDVEPAAADAPVTAQYQAGFATKIQGDSFIVTSPTASLVVSTFGPKVKFDSTPRTFKRDTWAFATRPNVAWNSVRAPYSPDPAKPLITVMTPQTPDKPAPPPTVNFAENQIDVQIASQSISFTRSTGKWQPIKP